MKQTSLHIATPCHENWNAMTPAEKGKFCHQCNQQVVDFTLMSDAQILRYLSSHAGKLCGRFDAEQLDRPLIEPGIPKKKSWYLALSLPFLLLFQKSMAQVKGRVAGTPAVIKTEQIMRLGDTVIPLARILPPEPKQITVHGSVQDEKGNPVSYAAIIRKGTQNGVLSDSAGRFSIDLPADNIPATLQASSLGFSTLEKTIDIKDAGAPLSLTLAMQPLWMGEVVTVGMFVPRRVRDPKKQNPNLCSKITKTEKVDSSFRKIIGSASFTVYPNPAPSGSEIKLSIKKSGEYELQLLDNSSALLSTQVIHVEGDAATISFTLPSQATAGVYYLRLINMTDRKSFLEKIMIK